MKTEQQKAVDKIKKCLKLAGSDNTNEAATALRQAQALMEKYNLSHADLDAFEVKSAIHAATVKAHPATWEGGLAQIIGAAFGCKLLFRPGNYFERLGQWRFVGLGVAPELAGYAFDVLLKQLKRDRAAYTKDKLTRCKAETKRVRSFRFCEAWTFVIYDKVKAIALDAETEKAIAAYMEIHHNAVKDLQARQNAKGTTRGQEQDSRAGFAAGKAARLNRGVDGGGDDAQLMLEAS